MTVSPWTNDLRHGGAAERQAGVEASDRDGLRRVVDGRLWGRVLSVNLVRIWRKFGVSSEEGGRRHALHCFFACRRVSFAVVSARARARLSSSTSNLGFGCIVISEKRSTKYFSEYGIK
jgi:hypothetical protein